MYGRFAGQPYRRNADAGLPSSLLRVWNNSIGFQFEAAVNCPQLGPIRSFNGIPQRFRSSCSTGDAGLGDAAAGSRQFEESKYPDLKGQWRRAERGDIAGGFGGLRYDASRPPLLGQEAPLTPEYEALYGANPADQAAGGQGIESTFTCLAPGMPRIMLAYAPMEVVVTADTTYILMEHIHDNRRIHTDRRSVPDNMEDDPQFSGYSIGRWIDEDGDGRYDVLLVETLKGPRTYGASGIPLHRDNKMIIRERIFVDRADANLLHDEITTIDNALTRPWVVTRNYHGVVTDKPVWWREDVCAENNAHVAIRKESYYLSADGLLMPAKKNQTAPDLRYFKEYAR